MYDKLTLPNGVRIVSEKMPYVRSAAVGLWVGAGSRDESPGENGSAHFIEHMLFKGTDKYTASELAGVMDSIGGQINAYTTRESTCFYARVLDTHLDTAIDLLGDMFFDSLFAQKDVESERGVVLEEIDMYNDSPEDMVVERLVSKCFHGSLGRPVLGTQASLGKITSGSLREFKDAHYVPEKIVIALSGSFTDEHIQRIAARFSAMDSRRARPHKKAVYTPSLTVKKKKIEQNHLCFGFEGQPAGSRDRFAAALLSSILGGGMSSRLFQTVREKHGLCYSIYSFGSSFDGAGFFGIVTALGNDTEEKAIGLIMDEVRKFREGGVTAQELDRAREQAKSGIVMSMEATTSRMNRIGGGELSLGKCLDIEEVIERYDAVTREDILKVAGEMLDLERVSFSAVGRVRTAEEYAQALERLK